MPDDRAPLPALIDAAPPPPATIEVRPVRAADLYDALLEAADKPATRLARVSDVRDLCRFLGQPDPAAVCALVCSGFATANVIVNTWRKEQIDLGKSPATVNRKLATVHVLVQVARRYGLIDWSIESKALPSKPYRDTAGPGPRNRDRIFARAKEEAASGEPAPVRNLAIVALLYINLLRRGEIHKLDLTDWEPEQCRIAIMGKARHEKEYMDVKPKVEDALGRWAAVRGGAPGPLFIRLDRACPNTETRPLSGEAVNEMLQSLARRAGVKDRVSAHGMRHQGITDAVIESGGNVTKVQARARHKSIETTMHYVDNLNEGAAEIGTLLDNKF